MAKQQKSKAQRERDAQLAADRKVAKAAAATVDVVDPKEDRRAESAERRERLRLKAIEDAKTARRESQALAVSDGAEPLEDFGLEGAFDDAGNRVFSSAGPRLPAPIPAFHQIPVKGEDDPRKPKVLHISDEQRKVLLDTYAIKGNVAAAAAMAGVSHHMVIQARKHDALLDAQLSEAHEYFKASLETEAVRRGRDGFQKPVFSASMGCVIGYERVFDGRLLELLLKRNIPEKFGDQVKVQHEVQGVLVLRDDRTLSVDEWVEEHAQHHEAQEAKRAENLATQAAGKT